MFSQRFVWNLGMSVKDAGERLGHLKLFRILPFSLICDAIIAAGFALREAGLNKRKAYSQNWK